MKRMIFPAIAAALMAGSGAVAQEATLAAGDAVRLNVLGREDLSGKFLVRGDGTLTLHLVGEIDVAGMTARELEADLEARISAELSLPASLTVEVTDWRPVYVLGDVGSPDARPYLPGMTVGKAVAVSGGLFPRPGSTPESGLSLRIASERGNIRQQQNALADLQARRIRLEAEDRGLEMLAADPAFRELAGALADELIAAQAEIKARRDESDRIRAEAAAERAELAQDEAVSLQEQQEILREKLADSEAAIADVESLLERGLTNSDRLLQLRRIYNNEKLELMLAASYEARARQSEVDARELITRIKVDRQREIANELATVNAEIRAAEVSVANSEATIAEFAPMAGAGGELLPAAYRIRRSTDEGETLVEADLSTVLLPGDLLEVRRGGWPDDPLAN